MCWPVSNREAGVKFSATPLMDRLDLGQGDLQRIPDLQNDGARQQEVDVFPEPHKVGS